MSSKPPPVLLGQNAGGNAAIQQMTNELIEFRKGSSAHVQQIDSL